MIFEQSRMIARQPSQTYFGLIAMPADRLAGVQPISTNSANVVGAGTCSPCRSIPSI